MKFNFRKVSAIASSAIMIGATAGLAAAANYPQPFVSGGSANVAIVYGTGSGVSTLDLIQAGNIQTDLQSSLGSDSSSSGSTVTGGDSVLIAKSSDNLNLGNTWSVFTGTVDDDDLGTLLADGTYVADDNDEFDYEQKIVLGTPQLTHFRDSDYESEAGLDDKTPTVGFKLSSGTPVMNYTLDFTQDAESSVTDGDLDDIEGSDLPLMGRTYYVSDMSNSTLKLTLLDTANTATVSEGETVTVTSGDSTYDVSIQYIGSAEVKLTVNGETSNSLAEAQTQKLSDGAYIGIKDIMYDSKTGSVSSVEFSIGTGKLELTNDAEIKLNDETVDGVKSYITRGTASGTTQKIDKLVIEWITDEEMFLTPESDLVLPGFEAVKFTMADLMRSEEEKITIEKDSDTSMQITVPIKDGDATFNFLYANSSGEFVGLGKASDERLATTDLNSLIFYEKNSSGDDYDAYFVASYNITQEAQSYLLRAKVSYDSDNTRNQTTIDKNVDGSWVTVCEDKIAADTCDLGDISLTINEVNYTSGGQESVNFTAGTNVNFNTIYTDGGLKIWLPFAAAENTTTMGAINFSDTQNHENNTAANKNGHSLDTFYLFMQGENKDDDIAGTGSVGFNLTIDDTTTGNLQVSQVNNAGSGGATGLELGETSSYEAYIVDDVAPRIVHYTNPDEDYAEVYYPMGDSETYAEVYLTEADAMVTAGTTSSGDALGDVLVKDSEVSSVSSKNLVIVGGSCINSAAATVLGGAYCGSAFTEATGVGSGEFLIKGVSGAYATGKLALVVAGYDAADTVNAATYLRTQTVDTSKEYKGTSSTSATLVTTEA